MAVNNNLYPPIVDTYMPAFIADTFPTSDYRRVCRVYFSISLFNELEDIKNAQVTVTNQYTNLTVLNRSLYPAEVMLKPIKIDYEKVSDDRYYIEIMPGDLEGGKFEINQYYKVQIRFTGTNASDISITEGASQPIDSWLIENLPYFSEWSSICLVRGISSPTLSISGFSDPDITVFWSRSEVDLIGNLKFADSAEQENLRSYRIRLYDKSETLLQDSDVLYTSNYNNINSFTYTIKYGLIEGETYYLDVEYSTQNLYTDRTRYEFVVIEGSTEILDATLAYVLDEDNGRMGIHIKSKEDVGAFVGNITIRRTSSESNFTIWEDVHTIAITEEQMLDFTWWDYTVESGVWYKYCAQRRSSTGQRGLIVELKQPQTILFDDMFLVGNEGCLKLRFDPTVSSMKINVSESKTDTIGSKYPFIKRNGAMYYRSFPIGGLISCFIDEDDLFTSREEILGGEENVALYDKWNDENGIGPVNDWTYEREFREKVHKFLVENEVRLFKSPTEGNILVKLMDVNLTPNTTLGRRLWSFTATAYEIDECSIENIDKYGVQSQGLYETQLKYDTVNYGQLQELIPANTEVFEVLKDKYQKFAQEGYEVRISSLDYLRLAMDTPPYLIIEKGGRPVPVVSTENYTTEELASAYLGYIVYINNIPILINPEGIYELTNENTEITSLSFPVDSQIDLEYNANCHQVEDEKLKVRSTDFEMTNGQCWGSFGYKDSVFQTIFNKYNKSYTDYSITLYSLDNIRIEAEPETVVWVKEFGEKDFDKHVIGKTCLLDFRDTQRAIEGIYFTGIHFKEANEIESQRDDLPNYKFVETGKTLDGSMYMKYHKLVKNGVYTLTDDFIERYKDLIAKTPLSTEKEITSIRGEKIKILNEEFQEKIAEDLSNNRYIWYNGLWWPFTKDNDLLCPIEAFVDYLANVAKERYTL